MSIEELLNLLITNEEKGQGIINMVPSENNLTPISRLPLVCDIYNRYFFNNTANEKEWNFRGAQDIYEIETKVAVTLLKSLGKSTYVNLKPISGLNAMILVLNALGGPKGSNIITISPEQGGHYATKDLAESLGYHVDFMKGINEHTVDFEYLEVMLKEKTYSLVYVDQSNCLFPLNVELLVHKVRKCSPNTIIHIDASHWLGLILGEAMENPLELGADSFGGSTHKSFPGPQRAVYFTNNKQLNEKVKDAQYYMISSHHFGSVASLAIALMEFKEKDGSGYAHQVIANAKMLGKTLDYLGYDVKGRELGYSQGNQIWMSTSNIGIDSYEASKRLSKCGIRVNVFDELPGTKSPILRIGVNEITHLGCNLQNMEALAYIMDSIIQEKDDIKNLREQVKALKNGNIKKYVYDLNELGIRSNIYKLLNTIFK
ncbi:hypothetical protein [Clostridium cibarium]|uniref:Serine hydroxymethyltransferase-like domain-containing protein n=1 Tax=Clostridium cibarium TaxID=2762247 RepID=A0ABR8PY15_9CLOT|nr:hypothetical protein [Clostridium cibarium]MBD7913058.1 hypothetical protein [Clostridium cibarium]